MFLGRRSAVLAGGASCLAALVGLVIANTPVASAHRLSAATTAAISLLGTFTNVAKRG